MAPKPSTYDITTLVAQAIKTMHIDKGFIPETASATNNTMLKVLAALKADPNAKSLEPTYWQVADDMLEFFRVLTTHPSYKSIMERSDGAEYKACHDAVMSGDTVTILTLPMVIRIPHLYGKLKPKAPKLNPLQTETKILKPGEYMGTLHETGRFFWKLVHVGPSTDPKGTTFKVMDRVGNIGFFRDRVELWIDKVHLSDCFTVHATPYRQISADNGEKHTVFRNVEFLPTEGIKPGSAVSTDNDESEGKKFCKGGF